MALIDQITDQLHRLAMQVRDHRRAKERREMILYGLMLFNALAENEDMEVEK